MVNWMDIHFFTMTEKKNRNKGFSELIKTTSRGHYKPIGGCLRYSHVHLILPLKKCWLLKFVSALLSDIHHQCWHVIYTPILPM